MNRYERIFHIFKIIFLVTFSVIIFAFVLEELFLPSEWDNISYSFHEMNDGWNQVMSDDSRHPVEIPGRLSGYKGEQCVIETTVSKPLANAGWLCIRSLRSDMRIYLNEVLINEYSTQHSRPFGSTSAPTYVFARFEPEDAGKTLTIVFQSDSAYSGIIQNIYYGTQTGIWTHLFRQHGFELILGLTLLLFSLICIILSVTIRLIYHKPVDMEYLGWGMLMVAIWVVASSIFRQLIFPNISAVGDMTFFALMLLPLPLSIYVNLIQESRYQKAFMWISILTIADTFICTALQLLNIVDFKDSIIAVFAVLAVLIIAIGATVALDVIHGNIQSYKLIAIGFLGINITGIIQAVLYLKRDSEFSGTVLCLGFILLMVLAFIKTIRDILQGENERQEAIHASKMKEEFLANMSHEIRTPLNAIIGLNDMVLLETEEPQTKEYAIDIKSASKSLLSLINDILDFSKIESGKMELVQKEYSTNQLLADCYNVIFKRAEDKNLMLSIKNDAEIPKMLYGDETRLRQIINNLLTNAVKYTEKGGVVLRFLGERISEEDIILKITVKDTGIGIREDDLGKLFESFERVDTQKNRNIEGTGLGLAITKQLTELMDGQIYVTSEYGKGSEFTVEIPQKICSKETMGVFKIHSDSSQFDAEDGKHPKKALFLARNARILVVDDVKLNLKVATSLIKDTKIHIDVASSGTECLEKSSKNTYDMIFLDHMMPEMDGIETLQKMRESDNDKNWKTPVIMLTANAVEGAKDIYLDKGFTDYLTKPLQRESYQKMLMKYLPEEKVQVL